MQCMNPEGLMIQQLKDKEDANIELTDELKEMFNQLFGGESGKAN